MRQIDYCLTLRLDRAELSTPLPPSFLFEVVRFGWEGNVNWEWARYHRCQTMSRGFFKKDFLALSPAKDDGHTRSRRITPAINKITHVV